MFWKKKTKTDVSKSGGCKCEVAGCGLVCVDETSLKRHMDWAHAAAQSAGREPQTPNRNAQSS